MFSNKVLLLLVSFILFHPSSLFFFLAEAFSREGRGSCLLSLLPSLLGCQRECGRSVVQIYLLLGDLNV